MKLNRVRKTSTRFVHKDQLRQQERDTKLFVSSVRGFNEIH
jgi:hypothetical protein